MPQNKASDTTTVVDITDKLLGGKAKPKKPFRMAAKDGVGEIFIFDDIGEGMFSDGITPKSFATDLKALGAVRTLNIFINSSGGSVFDGVAIFNQLKRHGARKVVFIDGIAASIASVIAMAGDEINIAANGFIMVHEPFTMAMGSASEFRKVADQLEKINDTIINTYAARTGTPENVIADLMAVETWMNAEEAIELGFADNISDEVEIAAIDLSQFRNVPEDASDRDLSQNPPKVELAWTETVEPNKVQFIETIDPNRGNNLSTEGAALDAGGRPIDGPEAAEDNPDEQRAPLLAITKMRQRIQHRGLARKGEEADQAAV